ncbi:G-protein alpha subunit-domain-containing protein [Mycena polygramma]|nr:G-protein alpha subunit-domain-containing protein [Mycena polygramma]
MRESLVLFESVINSRWFLRTSIILFLNKIDVFRGKLGKVPLERYFPEYTGGPDINKAAKYVLWRFMQENRARLSVYPQLVCPPSTSPYTPRVYNHHSTLPTIPPSSLSFHRTLPRTFSPRSTFIFPSYSRYSPSTRAPGGLRTFSLPAAASFHSLPSSVHVPYLSLYSIPPLFSSVCRHHISLFPPSSFLTRFPRRPRTDSPVSQPHPSDRHEEHPARLRPPSRRRSCRMRSRTRGSCDPWSFRPLLPPFHSDTSLSHTHCTSPRTSPRISAHPHILRLQTETHPRISHDTHFNTLRCEDRREEDLSLTHIHVILPHPTTYLTD